MIPTVPVYGNRYSTSITHMTISQLCNNSVNGYCGSQSVCLWLWHKLTALTPSYLIARRNNKKTAQSLFDSCSFHWKSYRYCKNVK